MKRIDFYKLTVALVALLLASVLSARAIGTATLVITDTDNPGATWTLVDNAVGDLFSPAVGQVGQVGSFSVGDWSISQIIGVSAASQGGASQQLLTLNFAATRLVGTGTGHLTIQFYDTSFGPLSAGGAALSVGGTEPENNLASVASSGQAGTGAGPLVGGTFVSVGPLAPISGNAFSGADSGSVADGTTTLQETVQLTLTGAGTITGNATMNAVPDTSSTLMLLGAAMSGLVLLRRKLA